MTAPRRVAASVSYQQTPLWVVTGLAMGPVIALGLGRFAYALLLPSMRTDLHWSFADAGAMNTVNAAGYLVGALIAASLGRRWGDKRIFVLGMLMAAFAIGASGLTADLVVLLVVRFIIGFTGALAFVCGAGLTSAVAARDSPDRAPLLLGIYFAGGGIGITASALVVPPSVTLMGWRGGWLALGALALMATMFGWSTLRRIPEASPAAVNRSGGGWSIRSMAQELVAYCLFGAGYIAYATFIVAYLRGDQGLSSPAVSIFWAILGIAAVMAAFAWGPLLHRLKGGRGASATIGVVTVGAALPLLWPGQIGAYLSAVLFGGSFLAVIAAVTVFARKAAEPRAWTAAIGALTVAFGLGQCIGPVLSGVLSDGPAGVRAGLWLSVGILVSAVLVALFQPEPPASASASSAQ